MTRIGSLQKKLGAVGTWSGLVIGLALMARLVQVHAEDGALALTLAIVYGVVLLSPFAVSLAALRKAGPTPAAQVWAIAGIVTLVLIFTSISVATLPLLVPAAFLLAGAVTAPKNLVEQRRAE